MHFLIFESFWIHFKYIANKILRMNIQLEKLFRNYNLEAKDRYEIRQIFEMLPDYKKARFLESFDELVTRLQTLRAELIQEQEILLGDSLKNIETRVQQIEKKRLHYTTKNNIQALKTML